MKPSCNNRKIEALNKTNEEVGYHPGNSFVSEDVEDLQRLTISEDAASKLY